MKFVALLLLTCLSLYSQLAIGAWVVVKGESNIVDGNVTKAREDAIHQALTYATLQNGASFTSTQTVNNGQLTQDSFSIKQQSQAAKVELINELIEGDKLTVMIRVDVIGASSHQAQCESQSLKAAILVPQSLINDRTQLRYGNIGFFEKALSVRISDTLTQASNSSFPHLHANERLDIEQALVDIRGYRLPSWLSEITDSQYVLLPEIIDISTDPAENHMLGLWSSDPIRQFQLRLSLYHGISGEQIWSQDYTSSAPWEFKRQETVPSNQNRFWNSAYGNNIDKVLLQAIQDIDRSLSCRPILGQIVAKQHDRLIINLGRRHGIRVGDSFQLVLQENFPDRFDKMRAVVGKSRATVKIDQVTQDTATAVLVDQKAAYNVQVNDIAIKI
ncbi:flagellar assembly protein FlgT [Shewanella sp. D64]|uniref:flagellar assembly protein FlgT n=1 Tax=unclassified Shewanella TaxID=196818 RepID=UPI0022BA450A|nr:MULTISPECIES: flagellar assembly protein FlgT [unclassified Shewanella]MEC4726541.1 flagellar assembly protein FlgT [Shewanella sp. D64]MEC4737418.1 flagellar assembly protein FlgT [Shewanella sp. E94]WBJ97237.1 flagellar assembly protein FlgT [Shewanella sp. MTB7]